MERWKILHSAKDLKQKKRNVKRSADVSGNARHFCDGELNYMIREKALRNESLENPSQCEGFGCGHYNLHKSINPIRHCHIHFLSFDSYLEDPTPPLPFSSISITIELTRKRSFPYAQKSRSRL